MSAEFPARGPDDAGAGKVAHDAADDADPGPWGLPWGVWRRIALLLPPPRRRGRRADTDLTAVVAAILHQRASGCAWRRLPDRFPPWQTVYSYHRRWLRDGTLRAIRRAVDGDPPETPRPPRRPR